MQTEQQQILERITAARSPEPVQAEPTVAEVVDLSLSDAPEEIIEDVIESEIVETEESEHEQGEALDQNDDLFYVDLDGEEITSTQIKEWKSGNMMQADYTRKTQELSDDRKLFNGEKETFNGDMAKLQEQIATLTALTETDKLTTEEIQELREYEPEKYIDYIERQNKIKDAIKDAKTIVPTDSNNDIDTQAESNKLFADNPSWLENGKPTKAFEADQKLINDYAASIGYTNADMASINQAKHLQTLLDAAKFRALGNKNASIEKKVRKAPVTTRPKPSPAATGVRAEVEKAQAAFKARPSDANAIALRKAKRKLNN